MFFNSRIDGVVHLLHLHLLVELVQQALADFVSHLLSAGTEILGETGASLHLVLDGWLGVIFLCCLVHLNALEGTEWHPLQNPAEWKLKEAEKTGPQVLLPVER